MISNLFEFILGGLRAIFIVFLVFGLSFFRVGLKKMFINKYYETKESDYTFAYILAIICGCVILLFEKKIDFDFYGFLVVISLGIIIPTIRIIRSRLNGLKKEK